MEALGHVYALSGRVADGLSLLHEAVEALESMGQTQYQLLGVMHLAEACLLADRVEDALALAGQALALTRERRQRGDEAWALRLLGEVASHRDPPDVEAAERHYREAMALGEELGMRPLVAHCHLGLGTLYRRTGEGANAAEHLTTATTMYRELDMGFWLAQAQAALGLLGSDASRAEAGP
jgi:tetratricopeptide (TPR) repeat protein